jgi:hypothetical protein
MELDACTNSSATFFFQVFCSSSGSPYIYTVILVRVRIVIRLYGSAGVEGSTPALNSDPMIPKRGLSIYFPVRLRLHDGVDTSKCQHSR